MLDAATFCGALITGFIIKRSYRRHLVFETDRKVVEETKNPAAAKAVLNDFAAKENKERWRASRRMTTLRKFILAAKDILKSRPSPVRRCEHIREKALSMNLTVKPKTRNIPRRRVNGRLPRLKYTACAPA